MLVEGHGYKVSAEILHLQSLHLVKGESSQKKIVISVTNLEHRLGSNEHVPHRLYHDDLIIVNKLHLLMKGRRDGPDSVDPRSAQKQVKGCRNPQNLKDGDKSGRTDQQLDLQCTNDLSPSTVICANGLSGGTEIRRSISKGDGSGKRTYVQGRAIVQKDRWDSAA